MNKQTLITAAGLIAAMLLLGLAANSGWTSGFDQNLAATLGMRAGQSSETAISFWRFISWTGGGAQRYIMVAAFAVILGVRYQWRAGVGLALASLLSSFASDGLKAAFARARPELVPHLDHVGSFAYPSGHATSAAIVYIMVALIIPTKRRGLWLSIGIVLTFLTGLSRIMLGVHWPSDVLGGWLLGTSFALVGAAYVRRWIGTK